MTSETAASCCCLLVAGADAHCQDCRKPPREIYTGGSKRGVPTWHKMLHFNPVAK